MHIAYSVRVIPPGFHWLSNKRSFAEAEAGKADGQELGQSFRVQGLI